MYNIDGKVMQMEDVSGLLETFTVAPNKPRKPNWTEREVMTLLEEYSRKKHILKPKIGVVVSMTDRQKCWCEIADVINTSEGINGRYRSVKEVHKKFENLSNRMRTEFATAKVEANFRLSETSVALNNILNGDGTFDTTLFARGYKLLKQERSEDDDYFGKDEDSHASGEAADERNAAREPTVPVLNIPFKANNRFQKSMDNYVPLAPRSNQIYSLSNRSSPTRPLSNTSKCSKPSEHEYGEKAFPSGDNVYVSSTMPAASSQTFTEQNGHAIIDNDPVHEGDKPNPETSAKLRQAMLKRANSTNCSYNSDPPSKRTKLIKTCRCSLFSDQSVTKLYKQVLILKKQTLKQTLEKQDLEKEKLKLETEKLKLETEAAKINRDKALMEMTAMKQK